MNDHNYSFKEKGTKFLCCNKIEQKPAEGPSEPNKNNSMY